MPIADVPGVPAPFLELLRAGMANETARKALEQARDDELVRLARTETGPGGRRKLYALMPEGDRAA